MAQKILALAPGFTDCTSLGEGRTYYVAGCAPNTGITIEAGSSTAEGPAAIVGALYVGVGAPVGASIRLDNDSSAFLRFRVTSGSIGTGQVWVTGPDVSAEFTGGLARLFWGVDVLDLRATQSNDIPPGSRVSGLAVQSRNVPIRLAVQTKVSVMSVAFEGAALNDPAATVIFSLLDGFGVVLASSPPMPVVAGSQSASVAIPAAVQTRAADSDLEIRATSSALLADLLTRARIGVS